ncbi:hypothetical protein ACEVUI_004293 [Salmonella enterica]|nr:hypothetical protein [Escherichia coli]EJW6142790.1 hypothetical protein [Salmonella enterica]
MMEKLYRLSNKPILIFSLIYMITLSIYILLREAGFTLAQAFNANVIGLLVLMFMAMLTLLRLLDKNEHKNADKNVLTIRYITLILQIMSYATLIMITPSILE